VWEARALVAGAVGVEGATVVGLPLLVALESLDTSPRVLAGDAGAELSVVFLGLGAVEGGLGEDGVSSEDAGAAPGALVCGLGFDGFDGVRRSGPRVISQARVDAGVLGPILAGVSVGIVRAEGGEWRDFEQWTHVCRGSRRWGPG
jgi:hypothetical protein